MALDPQVKALLELFRDQPPIQTLPVHVVRRAYTQRSLEMFPAVPGPAAEDRTIDGPAGRLRLRVYRPPAAGTAAGEPAAVAEGRATDGLPLIVFFHGGGWVVCDLDTHDTMCRRLCLGAHAVVVSVDYRLAPEQRFPAAPDDCLAATRWAVAHAASLGADASRLFVAGDSAGGNLAAVVAMRLRDEGGPVPIGQVLVYPVTAHYAAGMPSYEACAEGYGLTRDAMVWFWDAYLGQPTDVAEGVHPHAAPLLATDLRGLPPAIVLTAQYDVLRDEGEAFGDRLRQAGVSTVVRRYDGLHHGFLSWVHAIDRASDAMQEVCSWIRANAART